MEGINFKMVSEAKYKTKEEAQEIISRIRRRKMEINDVVIKKVVEQPPLLYDLTALQKDANIILNLTANQTLEIAQSLYEKKFIAHGTDMVKAGWREVRGFFDDADQEESIQSLPYFEKGDSFEVNSAKLLYKKPNPSLCLLKLHCYLQWRKPEKESRMRKSVTQ